MSEKRYSPSCENNRLPIIEQLRVHFANAQSVLEIGSGTGQHAAYFAPELTHLRWQTSDMPINHQSIIAWLDDVKAPNVYPPLRFTLGQDDWPDGKFDAIYSANTAHIMQRNEAQTMMSLIADNLPAGGVFCQYGPFTEAGEFSSASNQAFHQRLILEGYGGYRDIEELVAWVDNRGLTLTQKITMPANNLLLIWHKG